MLSCSVPNNPAGQKQPKGLLQVMGRARETVNHSRELVMRRPVK